MHITDRSVWTAPPPNPVRQATAEAVNPRVGIDLATYYYWIVAHYPIGNVIGGPFEAFRMPRPTSSQNPILLSWEAAPVATSYDILRTGDDCLPTHGSFCGLALGVTGTTMFMDEGQALFPYDMSGLIHGAPADGWAHMNNRNYSEPVLELYPTVQINKIIFSDGSVQATAGGGSTPIVTSVFGRTGAIAAQPGDYNASQISLVPPIGTWTNVQQAILALSASAAGLWQQGTGGAIYFSGGNVGIGLAAPGYTLDVNGSINASSYYLDGVLFAGSGGGGASGSSAYIGTSPPASPTEGLFWFNSNTLRLNIRFSGTWIQI